MKCYSLNQFRLIAYNIGLCKLPILAINYNYYPSIVHSLVLINCDLGSILSGRRTFAKKTGKLPLLS